MTSVSVIVNGANASATSDGKLTSGMVGVNVSLSYDNSWDGLTKNVTFKVGDFARTRKNTGTVTIVPWEVMRKSGGILQVGVEGVSENGDIVMPTIWANVGRIYEGATSDVPGAPNPENGEQGGVGSVIDDSQISSFTTWSSKNTIDKLCPSFTESGAIVTCEPVEGYPLDVAWSTKNLLKNTAASQTVSGVTFTVNADKTITMNGTATAAIWFACGNVAFVSGVEYMLSGCPSGGNGASYYLYPGSYTSIMDTGSGKKLTPTSTAESSIMFYVAKGITFDNAVLRPMVRKADTDSAYEPYAETATITRCGKNLAKLRTQTNFSLYGMSSVVDGDAIVFNGTSATAANNVYLFVNVTFPNGVMTKTTPPKFQPGKYVIKNELVSGTISGATIVLETTPKGGTAKYSYIALGESKTIEFSETTFISPIVQFSANGTAENARVRIQIERGNTATAFEPYNGETFELTAGNFLSTATVPALPGVNNILADTGEVTVTGRADPNAINKKTAERLAALEAALVNT